MQKAFIGQQSGAMVPRYFKVGQLTCAILDTSPFMCKISVPPKSLMRPCCIHAVLWHHRQKPNLPK